MPRLRETGANRRSSETGSGQENLASSAEVVVEGINNERTTSRNFNQKRTRGWSITRNVLT